MDHERFDDLVRNLARSASRRRAMGLGLGAAGAAFVAAAADLAARAKRGNGGQDRDAGGSGKRGRGGAAAAACIETGERCRKKRNGRVRDRCGMCCSGLSDGKTCTCQAVGGTCTVDATCCAGSCLDGVCAETPEPAGCIEPGQPCKDTGRDCCEGRVCASGQGGDDDVACYVPKTGRCERTADCVYGMRCQNGRCTPPPPAGLAQPCDAAAQQLCTTPGATCTPYTGAGAPSGAHCTLPLRTACSGDPECSCYKCWYLQDGVSPNAVSGQGGRATADGKGCCHLAGVACSEDADCCRGLACNGGVCGQPGGGTGGTVCVPDDATGCPAVRCCSATAVCTNNTCLQPGDCVRDADCTALSDACNTGVCGAGGTCTLQPKPNGTTCDGTKTCCSGTCKNLQTDAANCGACGTACTGGKTCSIGICCETGFKSCSGSCIAEAACCTNADCSETPTTPTCSSGTCVCTSESCGVGKTCASGVCKLANGETCENGSECASGNCATGLCCAASQKNCSGSCIAVSACCTNGDCTALDDPCNTGVCTSGTCGKQAKENGFPCDDANACTVNDTCQEGVCTAGTPKTCPANETCDPLTGTCKCGQNDTCGATKACTAGSCTCNVDYRTCGSACIEPDECCTNNTPGCGTSGTCTNGVCKCGGGNACSGTKPICSSGTCICTDDSSCPTNETCVGGACMCGENATCTGGRTCNAPIGGTCACDAEFTECGAICIAADTCCTNGTPGCGTSGTCTNGVCKCGGGTACSGERPFCDGGTCRCTSTPRSCPPPKICGGTFCVIL